MDDEGIATKLENAVSWVNNANSQWLPMIGGSEQVVENICQCIETPPDMPPITYQIPTSCPVELMLNNPNTMCYEIYNSVTTLYHETDGIVTKETALAMPGKINLSDVDARMEGSQHMQMRNDPNLKEKLFKLFRGDLDQFFITN